MDLFSVKRIIILTTIAIVLIAGKCCYNTNSKLDDLEKGFKKEHKLSDPNLIVISDSLSPDKRYKYITYKFDNGGFGYSRVFWSVLKIDEVNLDLGVLPDGYKAVGWTDLNEVIIEKREPYYGIRKGFRLETGDNFNEITIRIVEEEKHDKD
jgi:hypothetical protein